MYELKDHIANLALLMNDEVNYEFNFHVGDPTKIYTSSLERHTIRPGKYKSIYRGTLTQIMAITPDDFILNDGE